MMMMFELCFRFSGKYNMNFIHATWLIDWLSLLVLRSYIFSTREQINSLGIFEFCILLFLICFDRHFDSYLTIKKPASSYHWQFRSNNSCFSMILYILFRYFWIWTPLHYQTPLAPCFQYLVCQFFPELSLSFLPGFRKVVLVATFETCFPWSLRPSLDRSVCPLTCLS